MGGALGGPISKTILFYLKMVLLSAPLKTKPSQLQLSTKQNFYIKLATKKGLNNVKFEPSKPSNGMPRTQKMKKTRFTKRVFFRFLAFKSHCALFLGGPEAMLEPSKWKNHILQNVFFSFFGL